jgi:hypothetical protein
MSNHHNITRPDDHDDRCCFCSFCRKQTKEEKDEHRLVYRKASRRLIQSALPVFLAAGVNNFAASLIDYIADENQHTLVGAVVGQTLAYAVISYMIGRYGTFLIRKMQREDNEHANLVQRMIREKATADPQLQSALRADQFPSLQRSSTWLWMKDCDMDELLCDILAENAGFAWKEFMVVFVLDIFYFSFGLGAAYGMWVMSVGMSLLWLRFSRQFMTNLHLNGHLIDDMLHFDGEVFGFSFAFTLTVLCAVLSMTTGLDYATGEGFLFESWAITDDDSTELTPAGNPLFFVYFFLVSFLVGLVLILEEDCFRPPTVDVDNDDSSERGSVSHDSTFRETMLGHNLGIDPHDTTAVGNLWHTFLGYVL